MAGGKDFFSPVTMFRTGLMSAVKAGMSGWRCSHIGCQITRPLANRKVRSDSYEKVTYLRI